MICYSTISFGQKAKLRHHQRETHGVSAPTTFTWITPLNDQLPHNNEHMPTRSGSLAYTSLTSTFPPLSSPPVEQNNQSKNGEMLQLTSDPQPSTPDYKFLEKS